MLRRFFREPDRVLVDDRGVERRLPDGHVDAVSWGALKEVRVTTTDAEPVAEDVFNELDGGDEGCVVPQELSTPELLDRLQALPGFDNERMVEAMGSTDVAEFVLWRRGRD